MDQNLFIKHLKQLKEREHSLSKIITHIHERTGILLSEEELTLSQKKVRFIVSSAKKAALVRKNSKDILEEIGFIESF